MYLHPQALQRVFGPLGPLRHSGESNVPQSVQTYSSATLSFFFFSELVLLSRSGSIAIPASPLISAGLMAPVLMPSDRSPVRNPVNISICSVGVAPSYLAILSLMLSGREAAKASLRFCLVRAVLEMPGFGGGGIPSYIEPPFSVSVFVSASWSDRVTVLGPSLLDSIWSCCSNSSRSSHLS